MDVRKAGQEEDAARSGEPCDLVIRDCLAVDPVTRSIRKTSVGIRGARIAGLGEYRGRTEIDGRGLYASAGLIDAHVHIESSLCTPARYAELVLPCGTTQVIADPHEIANVAGAAGIRFMQESARRCPLKIRFMVPSCVPAAPFEDAGASLGAEETEALLASGEFLGLGEVMDVPGVLSGDRRCQPRASRGRTCARAFREKAGRLYCLRYPYRSRMFFAAGSGRARTKRNVCALAAGKRRAGFAGPSSCSPFCGQRPDVFLQRR